MENVKTEQEPSENCHHDDAGNNNSSSSKAGSFLFEHLLPREEEIKKWILNCCWENSEGASSWSEEANNDVSSLSTSMKHVRKIIRLLLDFLNEFSFLFKFINSQNGDAYDGLENYEKFKEEQHLLYFIWKDHYGNCLPVEWQDYFQTCSDELLIEMMNYTQSEDELFIKQFEEGTIFGKDGMPNSVKRFLMGCRVLRFHKHVIENPKDIISYLSSPKFDLSCESGEIANSNELTRNMSPKKIHEIERLAEFISYFSYSSDDQQLEDVENLGSGKGYLSHVLFTKYGLNVVAVDHNEQLVQKIQAKAQKDVQKKKKQQKNQLKAIASHLECNREQLCKMVNQMLETTKSIREDVIGNNCIVGLHTCGDLSCILMDMYVNDVRHTQSSLLKSLVNVGCCYHKLTEKYHKQHVNTSSTNNSSEKIDQASNSEALKFSGFPLSPYTNDYVVNNLANGFQFTRSGLILGCTENTIWKDSLSVSNNSTTIEIIPVHDYWKRNAFRCAMEYFLHEFVEKNEEGIEHPVVYSFGSIAEQNLSSTSSSTQSSCPDFVKYALAVLQRLSKTSVLSKKFHREDIVEMAIQDEYSPELVQEIGQFYIQSCGAQPETARIKKVDIFWTLRAIIGPVIESLILLDRYLFLLENNTHADIVQLFDEDISPRAFALFAHK
ncbi:predicted protein [Naegleria gruberi]|uniref:Predicted protein n=1 Tax=Naegleria gruberi TaxID=5762 RepID=D2VLP4_NAEGR|nr:uncharacterized protein NAEGRDRAFT_50592 [Naegleria gruberi]EFC42095.1 predicted protein [Naegleria gruberi]|eukprot:XP_002674839.1 predicted protein [Naegleria gruberi strain NEG-M]